MQDDLLDAVRALVLETAPFAPRPDEVVDDAYLDEEGLGFDSVALTDLVFACEDRFEVTLPLEELLGEGARRLTVGDLAGEISTRLSSLG